MPEFLETIETIRAEEASIGKLFGGEGTGLRGFSNHRKNDPVYRRKLAEAATLLGNVLVGRTPMHYLREAMGTSDFPILFADILDRQMLAAYREAPMSWNRYMRRRVVSDFRQVSRKYIDGATGALPKLGKQEPYGEVNLSDGEFKYAVEKYGTSLALAWQAIINDDLEALREIPLFFGIAARRTEELFACNLIADVNGPYASFFTSGQGNLLTGNPVLSVASLRVAKTVLMTQTDASGGPIVVDRMVLVVPPHLEDTANNIVTASQIEFNDAGGTTTEKLITPNPNAARVTVATNYFLPLVATASNVGQTSWFLFADPNAAMGRPAAEMGFLRGHEDPEIFMKAPNQIRIGASSANPMDGDFDTDDTHYKVRHVLGGTRMDYRAACASKGTGS